MVLTLAMSFAVTSSMAWCIFSPLIAEYMPRSIWGFSPCFLLVVLARSGDDGAVDVGEDVVAHVRGVDRGDDGLVADGDEEGRAVHEDDGLAPALARGAGDALVQADERLRVHGDPAALDALQRVA